MYSGVCNGFCVDCPNICSCEHSHSHDNSLLVSLFSMFRVTVYLVLQAKVLYVIAQREGHRRNVHFETSPQAFK